MPRPPDQPPTVEIRATLARLVAPGYVVEIRIPIHKGRVVSGYFDDLDLAAEAAASWNGRASGVYFTLNPVEPALLARAANRLKDYAEVTTSDADIVRRRWLP